MNAPAAVRFPGSLRQRIGAFAARLAAAREREEASGRRARFAVGEEFVGHRAYRPGDDLRQLDWSLYARVREPHVKVHRAVVREDWLVLVDASLSMGVGRVSKLQSAAEAAAAAVAVGLGSGARMTLLSGDGDDVFQADLAGPATAGLFDALERARPGEGLGMDRLLERAASIKSRRGHGSRVLLIGDFLDIEAEEVLRFVGGADGVRHRRRLHLGQVLAPEEWDPAAAVGSADGGVRVVDPERPAGRSRPVSRAALGGYRRRFEDFVSGWSALGRDHQAVTHCPWASGVDFERHVPRLLG